MIGTNAVCGPTLLAQHQRDIDRRRVRGHGKSGRRLASGSFNEHWIPAGCHLDIAAGRIAARVVLML
jgi:hypothetical protein